MEDLGVVAMIELDLIGRTPRELKLLKEQVMRSELAVKDKDRLIDQIDSALGMRYNREDILLQIYEGAADIDDMGVN